MSLSRRQMESEHQGLFALEFGKIAESDLISTTLSQNVCDHKILDEFDYGFNQTRTV